LTVGHRAVCGRQAARTAKLHIGRLPVVRDARSAADFRAGKTRSARTVVTARTRRGSAPELVGSVGTRDTRERNVPRIGAHARKTQEGATVRAVGSVFLVRLVS